MHGKISRDGRLSRDQVRAVGNGTKNFCQKSVFSFSYNLIHIYIYIKIHLFNIIIEI